MEPVGPPAARLRSDNFELLLYPGQTLQIGRAPENDVVLSDRGVSRMHAALCWNGTGFTLQDRSSVNGTFVNGERMAAPARPLRDADVIEIGGADMRYELVRVEAPPPAAAPAPAERAPGAGPRLKVAAGPDRGREYVLWGETVTIGRDSREATWEIRLSDHAVSRPHARLLRCDGRYFVEDLESANGTLLNEARLAGRAPLEDGDTILLGLTRLVFYSA